MYTPKDIAEAIAKMIPTDDTDASTISEEALKQLMKEGSLLYAEKESWSDDNAA
jgi:hypothetical protein